MKRLIFGVLLAQLLFSCSNDLEIYTEKTELPYVYGVITANQSEHIIKVTKTFQKLASEVAFNDLYYHDDSIKVYIDVFNGSNIVSSHLAEPVLTNNKTEGVFFFPTNKYYKVSNTPLLNNTNNTYSLRVELPNGAVVKNKNNFSLASSIALLKPKLNFPGATDEISFETGAGVLAPYTFSWSHKGGAREEATVTVRLQEINATTNVVDTISVELSVYDNVPTDDKVNAPLHMSELLQGLAEKLDKDPNIRRRMLNTEIFTNNIGQKIIHGYGIGFEIWSESKDLTTYETIVFSQSGISQDNPDFSNLSDALGMYSTNIVREENAESEKLFFGQRTLDSLACSSTFFEYNFGKSYIDQLGVLQIDDSPQRCN